MLRMMLVVAALALVVAGCRDGTAPDDGETPPEPDLEELRDD